MPIVFSHRGDSAGSGPSVGTGVPTDALSLPIVAFRGLWDKFAGPGSLGALRRAYLRGVPSLTRCGDEGLDLADVLEVVNDPAINRHRLPAYLVTAGGPTALFNSAGGTEVAGRDGGYGPFWADIFSITIAGASAQIGPLHRWDDGRWTRVGCYVPCGAHDELTVEAIGVSTPAESLLLFESANVIDDVETAARAAAPADDSVLASLLAVAGPRGQIIRVSDLAELDLLALRIREAA